MRAFWVVVSALIVAWCTTGCATIEYIAQAGCGQVDLGLRSKGLDAVLSDPKTPKRVRELLADVPQIKRFAEEEGLTPTKNYKAYADLRRPAAVWVVSASDPLGFHAKTWSFPIVGSVPYLGFFNRDDARDLADQLRAQGLDVDLRGAEAYSTLGWFDDPILSTMLGSGDEALGELANVVLHESVHASFYVPGQSALNESVADFLGDRLATAYLERRTGEDSEELRAYLEDQREHERRAAALHDAHDRLAALYASHLPRAEKVAAKARLLSGLRAELGFRRPINNATLHGYEVYNSGKVELDELYEACGESASRMLGALRELGPRSFTRPHEEDLARVLAPLVKARCPAPARRPKLTARR